MDHTKVEDTTYRTKTTVVHPHVTIDPRVLGGSPMVTGSRVSVCRLWDWHQKGVSVETLVRRYPGLGPAKVLDALSFAYDNRDLIEVEQERERRTLEDLTGTSTRVDVPAP